MEFLRTCLREENLSKKWIVLIIIFRYFTNTGAARYIFVTRIKSLFPGIALCLLLTVVARLARRVEVFFTGRAYLEALVIAILLGLIVRTFWVPSKVWRPGIV